VVNGPGATWEVPGRRARSGRRPRAMTGPLFTETFVLILYTINMLTIKSQNLKMGAGRAGSFYHEYDERHESDVVGVAMGQAAGEWLDMTANLWDWTTESLNH
jgi:hypothetical protein